MKIGKKQIGNINRVYIVAEAGINHNGDISIAKKELNWSPKVSLKQGLKELIKKWVNM